MNCPNPPRPINAAIVTRPIADTVAIRSPAMITGSASGISTFHRTWRRDKPIPTAASFTSASTASSPASVFRNRISKLYAISGMTTVVSENPVIGSNRKMNAIAGIVYRMPMTHVIGPATRRRREASTASGKAIANPMATEATVR